MPIPMRTLSPWGGIERSSAAPSTEKLVNNRGDLDGEQELNRNADGKTSEGNGKSRRWKIIAICAAILLVVLAVVIPVAVVFGKESSEESKDSSKHSSNASSQHGGNGGNSAPANNASHSGSHSSIPKWAQGGYLDTSDWYDTLDFNLTFTDAKVGGLYIMGLNDTWDDSTQANENVPALNEAWDYGTQKYRGVNLGGWLSIEPFITPSLFSPYPLSDSVIDEWTLCEHLGADKAKSTLEKHYSTWVQESTFAEIQAAGLDHIRIPFSYWAVTTYQGDPYVPMISWRYLLRGIEWARKYGLRVYLDLHAVPGSQNGWNHSGRSGTIDWLIGPDGTLNGQRTLEIHNRLSTFFSQPRYQNIVTLYGLVNEPRMKSDADPDGIPVDTLFTWYGKAIPEIQGNGYTGLLIMGDGLLDLYSFWPGQMQGYENLVLDAHPYMIFDTYLGTLNHYDKVSYACYDWSVEAQNSTSSAGFGPTMFGEWSQGDTDCTTYVNGVGVGARWDGTFGGGSENDVCPVSPQSNCSCSPANAPASSWSAEYKTWLLTYAEAQMQSFEYGWGWFYWTWATETAPQWSYKDGVAAGIMPKWAGTRNWDCNMTIPSFNTSGLPEWY